VPKLANYGTTTARMLVAFLRKTEKLKKKTIASNDIHRISRGRGLLGPGVHIISDKNSGTHFPTDTFFLAHQMPPGTSKANQLVQLFLCPEFLVFSVLIGSGSEPF